MPDSDPRGEWIRRPVDDCAVIFVHGIISGNDSSWRTGNVYWPELLAAENDVRNVGIYVFSYRTGVSTGRYNLDDVVDALKTYLELDQLLDLKKLIFVCHSMGGIIVRQFLVTRQVVLIEHSVHVGLFLVASPSLGSDYANLFSAVTRALGQSQAEVMRFSHDNYWLNSLDRNFINLKESGVLALEGKELVEDQFIILAGLIRKQVVQPFQGAKYFGESLKIPGSNHFTIATPASRDALQHRILVHFILDFLKAKNSPRAFGSPPLLEPRLALQLIEPESGCVIMPAARDRPIDVRNRAEFMAARFGAPGMEWAHSASRPLRNRYRDRAYRELLASSGLRASANGSAESANSEEVDSELEKYASMLWEWYEWTISNLGYDHEFLTVALRMFLVTLAVRNEGNCPADGVKVYLSFPKGISVGNIPFPDFRTKNRYTDPPTPPGSLKAEIDRIGREQKINGDSWYYEAPVPDFLGSMTQAKGLKLRGDSNGVDSWKFRTPEIGLANGQSQTIRPITLSFDEKKASDITVPFRLHASNQPTDTIGEIQIRVAESQLNSEISARERE
jgi:pimeloyl-ACP methyl ester carboxylesterase